MITCKLQGGLGNQMFQIAAGIAVAEENNDEFCINASNHIIENQGNHVTCYTDNIFKKINCAVETDSSNIYYETSFNYQKIPYSDNLTIIGYFQSEKYFKKYEQLIRSVYDFSNTVSSDVKEKYDTMNINHAVSIHVRRGDYLDFPEIHPLCSLEYYKKCIDAMCKDTQFFLFTDDAEWCSRVFNHDRCHIVCDNPDYIDMYLMSQCANNIISNSSFSWWGAWLNKNKNKKIFAPKRWFGSKATCNDKDIYCEGWIKI
jgi:hypothetical protein